VLSHLNSPGGSTVLGRSTFEIFDRFWDFHVLTPCSVTRCGSRDGSRSNWFHNAHVYTGVFFIYSWSPLGIEISA